jgi:hypothetical protein
MIVTDTTWRANMLALMPTDLDGASERKRKAAQTQARNENTIQLVIVMDTLFGEPEAEINKRFAPPKVEPPEPEEPIDEVHEYRRRSWF